MQPRHGSREPFLQTRRLFVQSRGGTAHDDSNCRHRVPTAARPTTSSPMGRFAPNSMTTTTQGSGRAASIETDRSFGQGPTQGRRSSAIGASFANSPAKSCAYSTSILFSDVSASELTTAGSLPHASSLEPSLAQSARARSRPRASCAGPCPKAPSEARTRIARSAASCSGRPRAGSARRPRRRQALSPA